MRITTDFNIIALFIFSWISISQAQIKPNSEIHNWTIGFASGIGGQNLNQFVNPWTLKENNQFHISENQKLFLEKLGLNVKYNYQVRFFQIQVEYQLYKKRNWGFHLFIFPQYNIIHFKNIHYGRDEIQGFECGLNVGMQMSKSYFQNKAILFIAAGVGPHYISGAPERQSKGFIFSDNVFIGLNFKLFKNIYITISPGFRHLSNTGMELPNAGINTINFSAGLKVGFI